MVGDPEENFHYIGDGVENEPLDRYKPGGLHPIILGDILPSHGTCVDDEAKQPRYRILQKLGFGGFSTVWLARDLDKQRYVALKACRGSDQSSSREREILRHLRQARRDEPGYKNVLELYDDFTIRGPNGLHDCLVTEIVVPLNRISIPKQCSPQRLLQQVLAGFDFLHNQGVVHGDPHLANFGITIPEIQQMGEDEVMENLGVGGVTPVLTRDTSFPRESLPAYIIESVHLGDFVQHTNCLPPPEEMCIKIIDFGRATWADKIPQNLPGHAPYIIRPPEVFLHFLSNGEIGSTWSKEADVWAVGCTMFQINGGGKILKGWGGVQKQLYEALCLGGEPPEDWSKFLSLQTPGINTDIWNEPVFDSNKAWESRLVKSDPKGKLFQDLVCRMIVTQPSHRTRIAQLHSHPFFS